MQVRVHQLIDNVQVIERPPPQWLHDVLHGDDVLMVEMPEQPNLSQGPARIGGILKCVADLLDGYLLPGL